MSLQVNANFSDMSNLREDDVASGATDYDSEKYFTCLCRAEKKARVQMKFNSKGVLGGGEGRYGEQLAYLGPYLMLLLAYLTSKGNMSEPVLAVH